MQVPETGETLASPRSGAEVESSLSRAELVDRIRWLIHLRWAAFAGVTITILLARRVFASDLPWGALILTALAIPVYNLGFHLAWQRIKCADAQLVERMSSHVANAQIFCDLLILTALIYLSGGVENLFCFYFIFHMVIASILLSRRAAFAQATLAVILFTGVAAGEYYGLLPHYDSPISLGRADLHRNREFVFGAAWVLSTSLYVTVYLATSISSRLRQREEQVVLLSRRVQRHAEELQAAYEKLARMEKAKSAYARKVAHEIRSPLAAIDNLLRAVSDGLVGEVPDQVQEMIGRSRHRTQELLALVNDLLALAAAREAISPRDKGMVDLSRALDETVSLMTAHAEARGIMLKTEVSPGLPPISADQEGIQQILTNLISNAIKYSPDGGVVSVSIEPSDSSVEIRVTDSGIGIDEADLPKVFDEFYRARNARTFTTDGTGLGLSIVKSIVEAHGGTISIESRPGEGTTFTVRLPALPPPP